jgi:hypothetical protein
MKEVQPYVRSPYPSLPQSVPIFIDSELEKIQKTLNSLREAIKELQAAVQALQSP